MVLLALVQILLIYMRIPFQIICNCYTKVFDIISTFSRTAPCVIGHTSMENHGRPCVLLNSTIVFDGC